jgi:phosphoribosylformylglycinamidine (FGAM) synthase-like amidotransferase family enzyme
MKAINVLAFPGTNCQQETARAIRQAGFLSRIFRWNDDPNEISQSDGLVIAGGFSFEDRGRSGVIAANDPVASVIRKMAAEGKPILGICNGAQVLVETGLVPGFHSGKIEMSACQE